ncbi:MAG TPA: prepilin peptidase, partial [Thermodesulfobacteriota bacterium]|nr:prepilin peptidase [Thermodesulfobacteriota bacterium]
MALILVFSFLLGSAIGSFLNVCIYRLPLNISIISP